MSAFFDALEKFNNLTDVPGSVGSIANLFTALLNGGRTGLKGELRTQSKKAYQIYQNYRQNYNQDLMCPNKEAVLNYCESCLNQNRLPTVKDMVEKSIASETEAKMLIPLLLAHWLSLPEFSQWYHDLLIESKMDDLAEKVENFHHYYELLSDIRNFLVDHQLMGLASVISWDVVRQKELEYKQSDLKSYYCVSNNIHTMLRVISTNHDSPINDAVNLAHSLCEKQTPVIITGEGGCGKSSLMLRVAVQWARTGRIALWFTLGPQDGITASAIRSLFEYIQNNFLWSNRILLCIDNPRGNPISLNIIQEAWLSSPLITPILAERCYDLVGLTESSGDYLRDWFDGAEVIHLDHMHSCETDLNQHFSLKSYTTNRYTNSTERQLQILTLCVNSCLPESEQRTLNCTQIINELLADPANQSASLAELIYLLRYKIGQTPSNPVKASMDWEVWSDILGKFLPPTVPLDRYGLIAAFSILNTPLQLDYFCRHFNYNIDVLQPFLKENYANLPSSPVVYNEDVETLSVKHEMAAELFFRFCGDKVSINDLIIKTINTMEQEEILPLLAGMVDKNRIRKWRESDTLKLNYWSFLEEITKKSCFPSFDQHALAYLCLGFLLACEIPTPPKQSQFIDDFLIRYVPKLDNSPILIKLYAEWGSWLASQNRSDHEKDCYRQIISLGRKVAAQPRGKQNAIEIHREVIANCPDNVFSLIELGRLLSTERDSHNEAREHLQHAMELDPDSAYAPTVLGNMFRQEKNWKQAETILRDVVLKHSADVSSRDVLAKVYQNIGQYGKAKKLYHEIIRIDPTDKNGQEGFNSLRQYDEECY